MTNVSGPTVPCAPPGPLVMNTEGGSWHNRRIRTKSGERRPRVSCPTGEVGGMDRPLHVVTGAFGYSGRWIAHHLLKEGVHVRTLTNAVGRDDPFDGRVEVHGLDFDDMDRLVESLRGAEVLYNTYWVRYNKKEHRFAHNAAVDNTRRLFEAAKRAGVKRVVQFPWPTPPKPPTGRTLRGRSRWKRCSKNRVFPTPFCDRPSCLEVIETC